MAQSFLFQKAREAINHSERCKRIPELLTSSRKTTWAYYGYNPRSVPNPPGLAPIGSQDFNANNLTLALRYSF